MKQDKFKEQIQVQLSNFFEFKIISSGVLFVIEAHSSQISLEGSIVRRPGIKDSFLHCAQPVTKLSNVEQTLLTPRRFSSLRN